MAFTVDDLMALEDGDGDEQTILDALQRGINDGTVWRLSGSAGRSAMAALASGAVMLGPREVRDAYGTPVPSRDQVKPGTKGSFDLVVQTFGREYAERLASLP